VPQRMFNEVLKDLLRDSEELPLAGPIQPSPDYRRWLERRTSSSSASTPREACTPAPFSSFPPEVARLLPWRG
jgi:hypothetical protein